MDAEEAQAAMAFSFAAALGRLLSGRMPSSTRAAFARRLAAACANPGSPGSGDAEPDLPCDSSKPEHASRASKECFASTPFSPGSPEWIELDRQLDDRHPEHLLARRISQLVDEVLDLKGLESSYLGVGSKPLRPDLLLKVMLFELERGRQSPMTWHADSKDSIAVRWLLQGMTPSKSTFYAFRDRAAPFQEAWNAQVLAIAFAEGWTEGEIASLDGTLMETNASPDKRANAKHLAERIELLQRVLKDPNSVEEPLPRWMGRTEVGRQRQLQRYQRAQEILQERLKVNARRRSDKRKPENDVKVSYADPESVFGKAKDGSYRHLYNVQFVNDVKTPLVLGYRVLVQLSDSGTLNLMLDGMRDLTGRYPKYSLVDSGYPSGHDLHGAKQRGVTVIAPWNSNSFTAKKRKPDEFDKDAFVWDGKQYHCPEGKPLVFAGVKHVQHADGQTHQYDVYQAAAEDCQGCPFRQQCTKSENGRTVRRQLHEDEVDQLKARMETPEAKLLYKLRGQTVERAFADVKEHRRLRRFSCRSLDRAAAQVGAAVLAHNLRTLISLRARVSDAPSREKPQKIAA